MSILYRYARWLTEAGAPFDPDQHLADERLRNYWSRGLVDLSPRSRDKHLSTLRTIAAGAAFADSATMTRYPLTAPYSDEQWGAYRAAALALPPRWAAPAAILLDLSGELGLRGAEINRARRRDIGALGGRTTIEVVDTDGRARCVPMPKNLSAHVLQACEGSDAFLLRPDYRNRRNTVSSLIERLARQDQLFEGFTVTRARHRWLLRLMERPVSTASVIAVAGLHGGNHAIQDLAAHLAEPNWDRTAAELDVAQDHCGTVRTARSLVC